MTSSDWRSQIFQKKVFGSPNLGQMGQNQAHLNISKWLHNIDFTLTYKFNLSFFFLLDYLITSDLRLVLLLFISHMSSVHLEMFKECFRMFQNDPKMRHLVSDLNR